MPHCRIAAVVFAGASIFASIRWARRPAGASFPASSREAAPIRRPNCMIRSAGRRCGTKLAEPWLTRRTIGRPTGGAATPKCAPDQRNRTHAEALPRMTRMNAKLREEIRAASVLLSQPPVLFAVQYTHFHSCGFALWATELLA